MVPEAVALVPAPFAYHRAVRHLQGMADEVRDKRVDFFHLCWPVGAGEVWTLAGPALGSPAAVLALEKLVVLGARRVLVLGPCGSLSADAPIGSIVLPTSALSEEGTSRLYGAQSGSPIEVAGRAVREIEKALGDVKLPYAKGPVWTTDAPYRETRTKVESYQAEGVMGVEMELAACLAAGAFRGVVVAGLFVVSDELSALQWVKGFDNPGFVTTFQKLVECLPVLLRGLTG